MTDTKASETNTVRQYILRRIDELEIQLQAGIEAMLPVLARREKANEEYNVHRVAANELWQAGDKAGWLREKTIRDELLPPLKLLNVELNMAKDSNAKIVLAINKLAEGFEKRNGLYFEYQDERLGTASKTISFPDNTPEWHAQRAKGIGGSDVGAIMGVSPFSTREDIFNLKIGRTMPEERQNSGALFRGSAWEPYIARMFAKKNPTIKLVHCKDSWQNDVRAHHLANIDGLLFEDGSLTPTAVLEVKTSSVAKSWEDGVPPYYRLQTLWYMSAFGINKAIVVVLINDHDFRQFEVVPEEGEIEAMHEAVDAFVAEVNAYKEEKAKEEAGLFA